MITSVSHENEDVVVIKRSMVYKRFYNSQPYPEEVIRIDRNKIDKQSSDIVLDSYADFGFKKEMTRLYGIGYTLKR